MPVERDAEQVNRSAKERRLSVTPDMRVRLDGAPINTTLATSLGTVIAEDQWDTYIVRLDRPAIYHTDDGTDKRLDEIRVLSFNLAPIN